MLEAIKRAGGDPPVRKGAGYNEVYTAHAGFLYAQIRDFRLFSGLDFIILSDTRIFHLHNSRASDIIIKYANRYRMQSILNL